MDNKPAIPDGRLASNFVLVPDGGITRVKGAKSTGARVGNWLADLLCHEAGHHDRVLAHHGRRALLQGRQVGVLGHAASLRAGGVYASPGLLVVVAVSVTRCLTHPYVVIRTPSAAGAYSRPCQHGRGPIQDQPAAASASVRSWAQ